MTQDKAAPDIRIGVIGLQSSGKSHMIAMLSDIYWDVDQDEKVVLSFRDPATAKLIERAKRTLLIDGEFIAPNQLGQSYLYRMSFEKRGQILKLGGFQHTLDIMDVAGEAFLAEDEKIYRDWLTKCNVLVVLIDGKVLQEKTVKGSRRKNPLRNEQMYLFTRLSNLIRVYLRPAHKGKHKIFVAFCVSKYDLFESPEMPLAEDLVRERLAPVYNIVEGLRQQEKDWVLSRWYGISSIGFVWDETGSHYVDYDDNHVEVGKRCTQYYVENGKPEIFDPTIIRPEGLRDVLEDIRKFIGANMYIPPVLQGEEVMNYRPPKRDIAVLDEPSDDEGPDFDKLGDFELHSDG